MGNQLNSRYPNLILNQSRLFLEYIDLKGLLFGDPRHPLLEMLISSSLSKTYFNKILSEALKLRRTREMPEGQLEIVAHTLPGMDSLYAIVRNGVCCFIVN